MKKLRHRESEKLAQDGTAKRWVRQDANPGIPAMHPCPWPPHSTCYAVLASVLWLSCSLCLKCLSTPSLPGKLLWILQNPFQMPLPWDDSLCCMSCPLSNHWCTSHTLKWLLWQLSVSPGTGTRSDPSLCSPRLGWARHGGRPQWMSEWTNEPMNTSSHTND